MWKLSKVLLLILSLILPAVSCSPARQSNGWVRHSRWSASVRSVPPLRTHRGIAAGFVRPEHRDTPLSQRPPIVKFMIHSTGVFTPLLLLGTGYAQPYPVLVTAFLDYEQVSFALDGQAGLLHYLEVPPGVDLELPIELLVPSRGWHDFFIVIFGAPENQSVDPNERVPATPALLIGGVRTVICVVDCQAQSQALPTPWIGPAGSARIGAASFLAALPLLPDPNVPPKRRLLQVAHTPAGQPFALQLWALNEMDQPKDYIVLPLLDYRQIRFGPARQLVFSMPAGSELFVSGSIELPQERGVHELQVVYILDPYQAIGGDHDPFVHCITRAALVVDQ